jgi:hypothetical protein
MNERRAHQCHRDGCASEAAFAVRVRLNCCAPSVTELVSMNASIKVCPRHRNDADVRAYIFSEKNKETIRTSLMEGGHHEPDFLSARIEFVPLPPPKTVLHAQTAPGCDRAGCFEPAGWQVKLRLRMMFQRGKGDHMIETLTNLRVCATHREDTKVEGLLDTEGRSATLAFLAERGFSMPDFDTAEVAFVPLVNGRPVDPRVFVGPDQPTDAIIPKRKA